MRQIKLFNCFLAFALFGAVAAQAQATRTWVSGTGDDVNPCSLTAPCKTFAGAISKTSPAGEINVLDPGGFGAVTITKSITIDGAGTSNPSILSSGTNGVIINAAATDVVTIRNLSIQGAGTTRGINGVRFLNGKALHVEHCTIAHFAEGIHLEPSTAMTQVFITDTISHDNSTAGLTATTTVANQFLQVNIDNSHFDDNGDGVVASNFTRFSIRNSSATGNTGTGFLANPTIGAAVLSIANSTSGNNGTGIQSGGGAAAASIRISGVSLFLNTNGFVIGSNGVIASFANNFNSGSGLPNAAISQQ